MTYIRKEVIGDCTLYLGDCREIMASLGTFDAALTDPPYGIGADEAASRTAANRIKANGRTKAGLRWKYYGESQWDRERPYREVFDLIREKSKHQIIWGGNYFTDFLPPTMHWLIWDKGQRDFTLADFEIAWGSQRRAARIFNCPRGRALRDGKEHPTQKPIEVMLRCLDEFPKGTRTVFDPFMGSGTTGIACAKRGLSFVGMEVNPEYFDIACRRIASAEAQPDILFQDAKAKAETLSLLDVVDAA